MDFVFIMFALSAGIQLFYLLFFFNRINGVPAGAARINDAPGVSVIVCALNEEQNLRANLPAILAQDYQSFELVVVDDASEDGTWKVLEEMAAADPRLKPLRVSKSHPGKKAALALGIRSAQYEIILLTDADCKPVSTEWIRIMASNFNEGTDIVLGYGPYIRFNSWLNRLLRFETVQVAVQFLSFALAGLPYMGVGRNLAYRRSLFINSHGFEDHWDLASGDDDLFVNAHASSQNTRVEMNPATYVYSEPKRSWGEWFTQKQRHLSAGLRYRFIHQVLLAGILLSQFFFYGSFFFLLYFGFEINILLGIFAIKTLLHLWVYSRILRRFGESDLLWAVPVLDFIYLINYFILAPAVLKHNSITWRK